MSTLSILDAHVHLWEPDRFEYEWLEAFPHLNQPHNLDDYTEATGEVNVDEFVFVECTESFDDRIECFGPDRLLFGGDWPVLRLAADYPTWVDLVETSIQSYSDVEQQNILRETARRVYDLA